MLKFSFIFFIHTHTIFLNSLRVAGTMPLYPDFNTIYFLKIGPFSYICNIIIKIGKLTRM